MSNKTFAPEAYQENKYLEKFDFGSKKISQILLFPASFNSFVRITNILRTKCCCFMTCTNLTLVPVFTGRTAFSSDAESCQLWTCIAFLHYYYYYIWYSFNVKFSSPCVLIFSWLFVKAFLIAMFKLCKSSLPLVSKTWIQFQLFTEGIIMKIITIVFNNLKH